MITGKDIVKYVIWVSFVLALLAFCVTFLAPRASRSQTATVLKSMQPA